MPQEHVDALRLPKPIQGRVNDLVPALNAASTKEDIEREGEMFIAFIMGLEPARRLRASDIESSMMQCRRG